MSNDTPTEKQVLLKKVDLLKSMLKEIAEERGLELHEVTARAEHLCTQLIELVPEIKSDNDFKSLQEDKWDPFTLFGIFGRFLTAAILSSSENDLLLKKAFRFVNSAYNDADDKYVRSILATEVFENLTISPQTIATAKKNLEGDALDQFSKAIS